MKEGVDGLGVFGGEPVGEMGQDGASLLKAELEFFGFETLAGVLVFFIPGVGNAAVEVVELGFGFGGGVESFFEAVLDAFALAVEFIEEGLGGVFVSGGLFLFDAHFREGDLEGGGDVDH